MDVYSDYANPVGFDQRLIMGKLGYETPSMIESPNVNERLKAALVEQELAESRRKIAGLEAEAAKPTREHFVSGGCGCSSSEGMRSGCRNKSRSHDDDDGDTIMGLTIKKFLVILVVIMAAFCVIQYFSHQNEMREMIAAMCAMMKVPPGGPPSIPVAVQSAPQAANTTA
jgi:hypothetical protein